MNEEIKFLLSEGELCGGLDKFYLSFAELTQKYEKHGVIYIDSFARGSFDLPVKELINISAVTLPAWNGRLDILTEDLAPILHSKKEKPTVVVFAGTEKSAKSLAEDLENEGIPAVYFMLEPKEFPKGRVSVLAGAVSGGFAYPDERFYV